MTLGEKIRKRRIELNMTMDDLGNAIGVQRSARRSTVCGFSYAIMRQAKTPLLYHTKLVYYRATTEL